MTMEKLPPNATPIEGIDLEILERVQAREFSFKWVRIEIAEGLAFEVSIAYGAKPEFRRAQDTEEEKFRRERGINPRKILSELQRDEIYFRAAFGRAIADWRGLRYRGAEVEFTVENLLRICLPGRKASDSCPGYLYRVRAGIMNTITAQVEIDAKEEAEALGNSPNRSAGGSGGADSRTPSAPPSSTGKTAA